MLEELFNIINDIPFETDVDITQNEMAQTIVINPSRSYFEGDKDELSEAWADFKAVLENLKDNGVIALYEDNTAPDINDPDWEINVQLAVNHKLLTYTEEDF